MATAKKTSFKKHLETISTSIHDQLLAVGVSGKEINDVVSRVASVQNPFKKKTLAELESDEFDALEIPETYKKLSDKAKALYFLRCWTTTFDYGRVPEPNKHDSVMIKQLFAYMLMLADGHDLISFSDAVDECNVTGIGKGFADMMRETARKYALDGFLDTCKTIGFIVDPNHAEFKAYPMYLQKWLHKFVLGTTKAKK